MWDANLLSDIKKFSEKFAGIVVLLLINFYSDYNQIILHSKSHNITAFQILIDLLYQIILSQKITNLVEQF